MKGEIKYIIKVACIYAATVIGAGFASGQELLQFFSRYYKGGFLGILLAGILFSLIGYIVLDKVYIGRIGSYEEFIIPTLGWSAGWIMDIVTSLFMLSVFSIMLAGGGNIISEFLGIPYIGGTMLMAFISMVIILFGIKGIAAVSTAITPVLAAGMLFVGCYIILSKDTSVFNVQYYFKAATHNWFFSALIYVSYNCLISITVLTGLLPYLKTRRVGIFGGIIGGALLCGMAIILNYVLFLSYPGKTGGELPLIGIIEKYSGVLAGIYSLVLWLAMLVSAVTSGYCLNSRLGNKFKINYKLTTVIMCALCIPLSCIGFSTLISSIYPLFGYAGLFLLFSILLQSVRIKSVCMLKHKSKRA